MVVLKKKVFCHNSYEHTLFIFILPLKSSEIFLEKEISQISGWLGINIYIINNKFRSIDNTLLAVMIYGINMINKLNFVISGFIWYQIRSR